MDVYLQTERMVLRQFTSDDLELLVTLDSEPGVKRYIDNDAPVDRDELAEMLDWWLGYEERSPGHGFWAAIERATGEFLGWFHLRPDEYVDPLEPELGYRLHRTAWGKGLATEGSLALIDHGFDALGARQITASTMAVNVGSRRVMEKAGMRLVRTFDIDWMTDVPGQDEGGVEYAITRDEWTSRRT
ncbi:MAG: GNAT family N-acetyltransferase [Ilumatobacteraceae bacterium]